MQKPPKGFKTRKQLRRKICCKRLMRIKDRSYPKEVCKTDVTTTNFLFSKVSVCPARIKKGL